MFRFFWRDKAMCGKDQPGFRLVPARRVVSTLLLATILTAGLAAPAPGQSDSNRAPARADSLRLEPEQQRELEHLIEDLEDSNIDIDRRRRAASILLDRAWPAAVATLHRQLGHADDADTKRAICQAIALTDAPSPHLVEPLVALLGDPQSAVRADAAAALARYDTTKLVNDLVKTATTVAFEPSDDSNGENQPAFARLGAITALAEHRNPQVVHKVIDTLVKLTQDKNDTVRAAAFASLTRLTGIVDHQDNAQAWQRWWNRTRKRTPERLLGSMMRNLAARSTEQANRLDTLTKRVVDAHQSLYDAAVEEQRPAILQKMIDDEMVELRMLALQLIERRILNAQSVSEEVRERMRAHLTDPDAEVRASVAQLFDKLGDAAAAERVVELVLGEWDPAVQARYFGLLARVPKAGAIEPALLLIDRPQLRNAVAAFLAASADAELLTNGQSQRALEATRRHLDDTDTPAPNLLRVLGRLGKSEDLPLLVRYLDHADTQVRFAAAEPFRMERWPVEPLLDYLADDTIGAVAVEIVGRRASNAEAAIKMLSNKPQDTDHQAKWNHALLAVIGRIDASELTKVDNHLFGLAEQSALHEELLKTAAGLTTTNGSTPQATPETEPVRNEASLRLAAFYRRHNEWAKAKTVHQRLTGKKALAPERRVRLAQDRIGLSLDQHLVDEATATTRSLLMEESPIAADALVIPWFEAAERAIDAKRPDNARNALSQVEALFKDKLNATTRAQLAMLHKAVDNLAATQPAP